MNVCCVFFLNTVYYTGLARSYCRCS